jgi:Cu-Zn family superoxide dismutase
MHGVHIHAKPMCDAPDFTTAGGHFNPDAKKHGIKNPMGHHNGDLPENVSIGEDHTGSATFKVDYLSLDPAAPNSIVANGGTAIMVHEKADDMVTDPTGNAGNRIACGVITAH